VDKKFLRIGYRLFNLLFSLRAFLSSIQHIRHHISENGGQYQTDEPFIKICAAFKFCLTGLYLLTDERWRLETVIQILVTPMASLSDVDVMIGSGKKFSDSTGEDQLSLLRQQADADVESSEADLFALGPNISYVPESWLTASPDFWGKK